jgi:hypothetical protein
MRGHIAAFTDGIEQLGPPGQTRIARQAGTNEQGGVASQNRLSEFLDQFKTLDGHATSQADRFLEAMPTGSEATAFGANLADGRDTLT